jgi:hypothetical protein
MKGRYYKPEGDAMTSVIDWLICRKLVRKSWEAFAERYGLEFTDLEIEGGTVTGAALPNPDVLVAFEESRMALLSLPSPEELGALLGVDKAYGRTTKGGTLVLVFGELSAEIGTEVDGDQLKDQYGIEYHERDCPNCKLMLGHSEKRCQRCGYKITEDD